MKVNIGPGPHYVVGWANVEVDPNVRHDYLSTPEAAALGELPDAIVKPWAIDEFEIEQIYLGHVIEHLPWESVPRVLHSLSNYLLPGAEMCVVVPDCRAAFKSMSWLQFLAVGEDDQHHQAHAAACLAEHGLDEGLALVFDGTGLGADDNIWGAELFDIQGSDYKRLATFMPAPLPGADKAVLEPIRQLAGRWFNADIQPGPEILKKLGIDSKSMEVWTDQCRKNLNAPFSHSAGRLFDAFSALLGFSDPRITYDAQAAIRLETAALSGHPTLDLPFSTTTANDMLIINWNDSIRLLSAAKFVGNRDKDIAASVHYATAKAAVNMIEFALSHSSHRSIALTGGVFMNRMMTDLVVGKLRAMKLNVLIHRLVPPNDACISLGQAVIAGH